MIVVLWSVKNQMNINWDKTKEMLIGTLPAQLMISCVKAIILLNV